MLFLQNEQEQVEVTYTDPLHLKLFRIDEFEVSLFILRGVVQVVQYSQLCIFKQNT